MKQIKLALALALMALAMCASAAPRHMTAAHSRTLGLEAPG